jgi:glycosyltransferase involved in cell wall biosynthesis
MRILHLSKTYVAGGAGLAAFRLHQALRAGGVDSLMLVDGPGEAAQGVTSIRPHGGRWLPRWRARVDSLPWRGYPQRWREAFSIDWLPSRLAPRLEELHPDLVHLHWLGGGMLRLEELAACHTPLVWTLHDMWPFTGGCHHSHGCLGYQEHCGACPILGSGKQRDLSFRIFARKLKAWQDLDLSLVSPSRWLAQCAQDSRLFKPRPLETIRHGVDLTVFKPRPGTRQDLGLAPDKLVLLFGAEDAANNPYKGFDLLLAALAELAALGWGDQVELLVFGSQQPQPPPPSPLAIRFLGPIADPRSLAQLYSAADLLVAPSREEALGLTVMEALACGTPVAAFDVGGIPDMVDHGVNGLLVKPGDSRELARAIDQLLANPGRLAEMGRQARRRATRDFAVAQQAASYKKLYEKILAR